MKFDELLNEQSTNSAAERFTPRTPPPTPQQLRRAQERAEAAKPLETRAEVLEAIQLLSGGKSVRLSSINGGKRKKKVQAKP